MHDRPWHPPARHWEDRPHIIGGLDEHAGGTWLGLNDDGVFACVLNRYGTLGPAANKRSRGELVLDALDFADAADAAEALQHLNPQAYRPFNLVVADNTTAFVISNTEEACITCTPIPAGVHMITAFNLNDANDVRASKYLPLFRALPMPTLPAPSPAIAPDYQAADLQAAWRPHIDLLGDSTPALETEPRSAMCFQTASGFGTSSAAILGLPHADIPKKAPFWLFAGGKPAIHPFQLVATFG
jgi:hypothetical protein